jgi:hypothetical protein
LREGLRHLHRAGARVDLAQKPGVLARPAADRPHEARAEARQDVVLVVLVSEGVVRRAGGARLLRLGRGRVVGEALVVEEARHRVVAEAVDAARAPEAGDRLEPLVDARVVVVEAGLAGEELVQAVLPALGVPAPRGLAEEGDPIVGRAAVGPRVGPDVEIGIALLARERAAEPLVRVGGVVEDLVDHDEEAEVVRAGHQPVEVGHRPEAGIHRAMVRHVVAAVHEGRDVEGREPDRVHPERGHVVETLRDAAQVALTSPGAVGEGAGVDVVDGRVLGPWATACHGVSFRRSCRRSGAASGP